MQLNTPVKNYIKCPHCGMEYVPSEIIHPSTLLSKPSKIIRDPLGKIIWVQEERQSDFIDTYICDQCDREFVVSVNMTFKVDTQQPELDFTNKVVSLLG